MGLSFLVITPTIGSPELADAVHSVLNQTNKEVEHLLVVDGVQFSSRVDEVLNDARIITGGEQLMFVLLKYLLLLKNQHKMLL